MTVVSVTVTLVTVTVTVTVTVVTVTIVTVIVLTVTVVQCDSRVGDNKPFDRSEGDCIDNDISDTVSYSIDTDSIGIDNTDSDRSDRELYFTSVENHK